MTLPCDGNDDPVARTYAYNGDGLLQSRTGTGATSFLWDPASSPSRELKQGSDNIVYGLGPLYVVKADSSTLTFARDGSKNVRAEVNSSGAITAALRYRAYGAIAQSTASAPSYLGLASQLLDPSGLYYMRARWYDAAAGRFLSRDPNAGSTGSPRTLNAFGYAFGNPMMNADPAGTCPITEVACLAWYSLSFFTGEEEADAAVLAAESDNPVEAAFGYIELSAGLVAGGAGAIVLVANIWYDIAAAGRALTQWNSAAARAQAGWQRAWSLRIAGGHAYDKHIVEFQDLGITSDQEFASHIEGIMTNPTEARTLTNGRSAFWDARTSTVVIRDPGSPDGGTAFRATKEYFDNLR